MVEAFRKSEVTICTESLEKGLTSDAVLSTIRPSLRKLGSAIEDGKTRVGRLERPVFFGENGAPALQYQIDAFHPSWKAGLEVEAGRAWMGNAVYRDLVLTMVMVNVDHLFLAVPNSYKFFNNGKQTSSRDYENTISVADALYGHTRVTIPYGLTVIGY